MMTAARGVGGVGREDVGEKRRRTWFCEGAVSARPWGGRSISGAVRRGHETIGRHCVEQVGKRSATVPGRAATTTGPIRAMVTATRGGRSIRDCGDNDGGTGREGQRQRWLGTGVAVAREGGDDDNGEEGSGGEKKRVVWSIQKKIVLHVDPKSLSHTAEHHSLFPPSHHDTTRTRRERERESSTICAPRSPRLISSLLLFSSSSPLPPGCTAPEAPPAYGPDAAPPRRRRYRKEQRRV
ncbi:hypothetical protein GUJ93_ZPchr0013g36108 [Zizania palustris]|uniref:Uncharacterized protein n=1 Tax=Zizania palustris TaxID=103762 RepID=A0A8J5WZ92_ZIZPA|nr:hypothetical protein GUJ93_ZPchr0013g36108 [Zizania palustris]